MKLQAHVMLIIFLMLGPVTISAIEKDLLQLGFGQLRVPRKHTTNTIKKRNLSPGLLRDRSTLDSFFEDEASLWMTRELASMSMLPSSAPTTSQAPVPPTVSPAPSFYPSVEPTSKVSSTDAPSSMTTSPVPSPTTVIDAPTSPTQTTAAPTTSPTATSPTETTPPGPSPTETTPPAPSDTDVTSSPSAFSQQAVILTCSQPEEFIVLVRPPYDAVTAIPFKVGYVVESSEPLEEYVDMLELQILEAATAGALQCNTGGPLFGGIGSGTGIDVLPVAITTLETGEPCEPEISECIVLETSFEVLVADDLDPDVSAFLGYVLIKEEMDGGEFVRQNPTMDRVEYLSPLPLLPPLGGDGLSDQPVQPGGRAAADQINVSPWTLGAVITMSAGGVIALGAWLRNRRNRNQRHMNLIEEMSLGSPEPSTQT